jgi:putative DNA primase/helicase
MTGVQIDFAAINVAALATLPRLLAQWFPAGRRAGHEYQVGNLRGDPGTSLRINLKTGLWADFSTGEKGGDPISLVAAREGLTQFKAAQWLADILGIVDAEVAPRFITNIRASQESKTISPIPADIHQTPATFRHPRLGTPTRVWCYRNSVGEPLGFVCRFDVLEGHKEILPRVWTSAGWAWRSFDKPRPLYGLDRLAAAPSSATVVLVEGEKACDAAISLLPGAVVITWPGGGNAVNHVDWSPLRGRNIVIWPDRDLHRFPSEDPRRDEIMPDLLQPGIKTGMAIGLCLEATAAGVSIADPSGVATCDGWDAADAVDEGWDAERTAAWLRSALRTTAECRTATSNDRAVIPAISHGDAGKLGASWQTHIGAPGYTTELKSPFPIRLEGGRLPEIATAGEEAIMAAGMAVFRRWKDLVRPVVEEVDAAHGRRTNVARLVPLDIPYLRDLLGKAAEWERFDQRRKEWVKANVPKEVPQTILCRFGDWTFRQVEGVLTTPTLRPDGSLLATPGYDDQTRLLLVAPPIMPPVSDAPTQADAADALALLDGVLEEFSFVDDASRSVALSALITPVVRGAFSVAPMHTTSAPVPGSGKSFLFDVAAAIALGQPCPVLAAGRSEEETEKRLGAALLTGQPLISIDNVNGELGGDALCQIVERPIVEIRVLGKSELARIETRGTTLFATGNNLVLVGDLTRRALLARLDPQLERPEMREFRRNPVADILADRGKYIAAALTVVLGYRAAGSPSPAPRLASFEGWSDTVRSALIWLGRRDPVLTMERARDEDPRLMALSDMLSAWKEALQTGQGTRRTAAEILQLVEERHPTHSSIEPEWRYPDLRAAVFNVASSRGHLEARTLGRWLTRHRGRIVRGCSFAGVSDKHGHGSQWWIEKQ